MNKNIDALPLLSKIIDIKPGEMTAVMGAGGKATITKRLVIEFVEAGKPVLVTGTTNLQSLQDWSGPSLLLSEAEREKADAAAQEWAARGAVVWVEKKLPKDMFLGIPLEQVEALHAMGSGNVLIVKTDGARKRLIKAPSETEPVIPGGVSHCILVQGLKAIGMSANPDIVFRFETSCRIGGFAQGDTLEPRHLAALASHPESYPARLPASAKKILYLSHCLSQERLRLAEEVWESVPEGIFDMCVTGDSVEGRFYLIGEKK
ncbi:MAG: putative selenium-dependent hydroxylase accessory protein YqeC [Nitrospinaceae bacterium]|jgi:probable selenium-dependent hydroxylase accessory protein YqeC|nr:putative selenium-dependent hydroxylase accessory protein YqeC [Nitrospinaceae bacterium]MBT3434282.1 putative selenium-dependent hydroxylase accessory protein YqeC [Nitrospinaceae bacterium]MBT3822244.1 putative selenium-dependent hydroxylase accessory protein YqeC [Nitrospinaceae bacterium]MBT4093741.1 putative selenium-dependent hydroxylase accessory protein YqeC [Nitrospinaceae bacterium]MBT4429916.1 putative selenium-dependent hydroxylase accessory protein YqeC [Nitrospinaceae bacterium